MPERRFVLRVHAVRRMFERRIGADDVCRAGVTRPGTTTVTLARDGRTVVVRGVPAAVCKNCGEDYVGEREVAALMTLAEASVRAGVEIEVRAFAPARAAAGSARPPDVTAG